MSSEGQQQQQQPAAWHAGLDAESAAHLTGRGWDKLEPAAAAIEAVKAHRAAEKLIGVPAENILRKPKDAADVDNWSKIHEVLGVPKDAKDYDFSAVKFTDNTELDTAFADKLRASAVAHKLSKDQATGVARDVVKMIEEGESSETTEYTTKLEAEKEALKVNWGANNYATNLIIAQNAAAKLGIDAEAVAALEKVAGYSKVMEMFRNIGTKMGEDTFVTNGGGPNGGPLTVEQATAELSALARDADFNKKYEDGNVEAVARFNNLTRIKASAMKA